MTPPDPGKSAVAAAEAVVYREILAVEHNMDPHFPDIYIGRIGQSTASHWADHDRVPRHRRVAGPVPPT